MKTRSGFVSNSSSSSFVVVFNKKPESVEDVKRQLFNNQDGTIKFYDYDEKTYDEISNRVFNDLKNKDLATVEELANEFENLINSDFYECTQHGKNAQAVSDLIRTCYPDPIDDDFMEKLYQDAYVEEDRPKIMDLLFQLDEFESLEGMKEDIETFRDKIRNHLLEIQNISYDARREKAEELAKSRAIQFIIDHEGWWYTILEYGDEDGDGLMEHCNIFRHIEHIHISKH
jgi:hypothetical protein